MAAAAAQDASVVKRARFQASIDAQQLARFQSALGDGLLFGIVRALSPNIALSSPLLPIAAQMPCMHSIERVM